MCSTPDRPRSWYLGVGSSEGPEGQVALEICILESKISKVLIRQLVEGDSQTSLAIGQQRFRGRATRLQVRVCVLYRNSDVAKSVISLPHSAATSDDRP